MTPGSHVGVRGTLCPECPSYVTTLMQSVLVAQGSPKQHAEIRVVMRKPGQVGLWGTMTIDGLDVYTTRARGQAVDGPGGRKLFVPLINSRTSYHETGQMHSHESGVHFSDDKVRTDPHMETAPGDLRGAFLIDSWSYNPQSVRMGYVVRNKRGYETLELDYEAVRRFPSFALD